MANARYMVTGKWPKMSNTKHPDLFRTFLPLFACFRPFLHFFARFRTFWGHQFRKRAEYCLRVLFRKRELTEFCAKLGESWGETRWAILADFRRILSILADFLAKETPEFFDKIRTGDSTLDFRTFWRPSPAAI